MNAFSLPSKREINFAKIRGFKVTDYTGTERPIRWARGKVVGAGCGVDSRPGSDAESGEDGYNLDAGGTAQSVAGSARAGRRRMPESRSAMADTVCASGPKGRFLPARNTSGGILPGGGVEE